MTGIGEQKKHSMAGLPVLYSKMSTDILEILPLPFLITGSSCARENLRKNLSKATKSLEVEIAPRIGIL